MIAAGLALLAVGPLVNDRLPLPAAMLAGTIIWTLAAAILAALRA